MTKPKESWADFQIRIEAIRKANARKSRRGGVVARREQDARREDWNRVYPNSRI